MNLYITIFTTLAWIAFLFLIKTQRTTNSSTYAVWIVRFFFLLLCLVTFFISVYFSEPIYCSSPDIADKIHSINSAQSHNWQLLSDSLRAAMNAELARRRQTGVISSAVNLKDIGLRWSPGSGAFPEYPGLASLYAIRPEWFERKGDTRVDILLENMASNLPV